MDPITISADQRESIAMQALYSRVFTGWSAGAVAGWLGASKAKRSSMALMGGLAGAMVGVLNTVAIQYTLGDPVERALP